MDFTLTPDQEAFRQRVRSWLQSNIPDDWTKFGMSEVPRPEAYAFLRKWQATLFDAGFIGITWPKEYGGRSASPIEQVIWSQEEGEYIAPRGYFEIGLGMIMPTLFAYATEEQKRRYPPKALRGDEIWCQLFSEPAAGSDLAGLRTRAVKDGNDWVINGQKIWTSGAHRADYGVVVTRSDPNAP